jgi:hypothetical protein
VTRHADGSVGKKPVSRLLGQLSDGDAGKLAAGAGRDIARALDGRVKREKVLGERDVELARSRHCARLVVIVL